MNVPVLPALLVTLFTGALATTYLWRIHRQRVEARVGIRSLAAMRWREFSRFVVTSLQAQGFDAHSLSEDSGARDASDLLLTRDNRSWLLSCRQSPDYVVTPAHLHEMSEAVRKRSTAGGLIATLGRISRDARHPPQGVELLDGDALWALIRPLLPPGLQDHVAEEARAGTRRLTVLAWLAAPLVGVAFALALSSLQLAMRPAAGETPQPAQATRSTPTVPADEPTARAPALSDEQQREQVIAAVGQIPRVESVNWATKSTLLIVAAPGESDLRPRICAVLESFEALRASRVQLQPAAGSPETVRFFHCRLY